MVVFGDRKYACLSCIRGHRSSACEHRDRILLQVRKPGRKPLTEPQSRYALVKKELSPSLKSQKESDFKLVKVPNVNSLNDESEINLTEPDENENEDVVVTEKYVFVHVGDNLFRRDLRLDYGQANSKPKNYAHLRSYSKPTTDQSHASSYFSSVATPSTSARSSQSPSPPMDFVSPHNQMLKHPQFDHTLPTAPPTEVDSLLIEPEAPLVIGPMQYQNDAQNRQTNILNELGLSAEEANQIWSNDVGSNEFSFASQCVLPGQCHCGDDCECPGCYEHHRAKQQNSVAKEKQPA